MRQAALLVALVCLLVVPASGAVGASGSPSPAALQADPVAAESAVDVHVEIQSDGTARWTVSSKHVLEDDSDVESFEELRQSFEAYETDTEFSVDVFRSVAPSVSDSVGRSMEIRAPNRSSRVVENGNNSTGVLTVQFTWTNFSMVDDGEDGRLVVDSFSGGWFGDLAANQTLTVQPPDGYDVDQVQPGPDSITDGAYQWSGPRTFETDEPNVVFTQDVGVVGVSMLVLVGVGVLALVAGGASVWAYYRGKPALSWLRGVQGALAGEDDDAESEDESAEQSVNAEGTSAAGGAATGGTTTDGAADEPSTDGTSADEAEAGAVDPELLSDEERVERLLREHGGRMKQSKIVEETRWSTAKVSQLLSSMADEERVEKLRIGRENLISLPGEGVDDE